MRIISVGGALPVEDGDVTVSVSRDLKSGRLDNIVMSAEDALSKAELLIHYARIAVQHRAVS